MPTSKPRREPIGVNQNGSSVCPVCEQQVSTHRYVQLIPLRPAKEGERVVCTHGDCFLTVPHFTEDLRVKGKVFVCLHEIGKVADLLQSLDWSTPWELRHCPPTGRLEKVIVDNADSALTVFACWRKQLVDSFAP